MTDSETITVADVSAGPGGDADADPGTPVSLPVVELLTGRGFVTGKSGSGKSNTASVLVENLLDQGLPVLVVDTDGEYYGLKEEYELLHAGADEECDIQVSPEHAEKLASLALEGNVPIILDVSGYLDDEEAKELLLSVSRHLFAKEKKLKKPFLMLVEEIHEYVPEGGGVGEAGKMLIKIGKRGRKHGLGIVGISQRPADVKKDYITQCDWLVWHRLTWNNDTDVVRRIIDAEHAGAVEDLSDGEAFLMTDWSESVRRVQFHRKRTFDAGATPGLEDFERPELKSVSDDLVSELRDISEEQERRESELADLRQQLERKERRIEELERELSEARDLSRMADEFARAMQRRGTPSPATSDGDADAADGEAPDGEGEPSADDAADGGASFPVSFGGGANDGADETADGEVVDSAADADGEDAETDPDEAATARPDPGTREAVVEELRSRVADLPDVSRRMLAAYRERGTADPVEVHVAAGGTPDEPLAYGRNRPLRRAELVEHVGRGTYRYAVPDRVDERMGEGVSAGERDETVRAVESAFVDDPADEGSEGTDGDDDPAAEDAADDRGDATADGGAVPAEIPEDEREDVEVVADDEGVQPDDGFVAEDAAIIDDGAGGSDESAGDDERATEEPTDDGESDDQGGVEIL
jgi:hypothetical protein